MNSRLWYRQPAPRWVEYLPIGNGTLGAMVSGGLPEERLALNHEWLWRANGRDRDIEPRSQNLPEIRDLFFQGKVREASELANERLGGPGGMLTAPGIGRLVRQAVGFLDGASAPDLGEDVLAEVVEAEPEIRRVLAESGMEGVTRWMRRNLGRIRALFRERGLFNRVDPYQPAGDLLLLLGHNAATGYVRELDLSTGIAATRYESEGIAFHRTCFAHSELPVICLRLTASEPGGLSLSARYSRAKDPDCCLEHRLSDDTISMIGTFDEGSRFCILTKALVSGAARMGAQGHELVVAGASEMTLLVTVAVAHDGEDVEAMAAQQLARVPENWDLLERGHREAFSELYDRVALEIGDDRDELPTDERLAALRSGEPDDGLLALYFDYGRYLLISSSRPGGLPPNLQGIWNENPNPPWQCDLHHDVNLQMNYWAAEICGLPECIEPLFDYMERLVPHGREMARALYDCDGILLPILTDPWGRATPEAKGWDVWTGAAAWLAQHMWWRYEYGGDVAFLRERAYPFLRGVAAFYQSYLIRDPQGRLVTVPSQSPENYFQGGTRPVSLCVGATMDFELIHDALTHAMLASEILGVDADLRGEWIRILDEIPPLRIGRHGQLQEWLEDYEEGEVHHRHLSHLVGAFPGDQITVDGSPNLAQAVRVTLGRRLAAGAATGGWSAAWVACLWARLRDAELAHLTLRRLVADSSAASLLNARGTFQIDGNFGGQAAVAEMLLQSHGDAIRVLPSLPRAWAKGSFRGFRARGGFELDATWDDSKLTHLVVRATRDGPCRLALPADGEAQVTCGGESIAANSEDGLLVFGARAGRAYAVKARGEAPRTIGFGAGRAML
jgi:alpha-L-fucosidase 2